MLFCGTIKYIAVLRTIFKYCKRAGAPASLSMEAAIAFPFFLFCIIIMMTNFRTLMEIRNLQWQTEEQCRLECEGLMTLYNEGSVDSSSDNTIAVKKYYTYQIPFGILSQGEISQEVISSKRAWIGYERSDRTKSAEDEGDPWVYIGKNRTRYHLSAECHYLSNNYSTAGRKDLSELRNKSGNRYTPCERCAKNISGIDTFYVTESGSKYHTDKECSAMKAYPERVRLSEVKDLGACSYCGRKK